MPRAADAIMPQNTAFSAGKRTLMVNPVNNGHMGYMQDYDAYIQAAPYVRQQMFCRVLETPRGFNLLPNPTFWHGAAKSLIEVHSKTWEGFNTQMTMEARETPFGADGQIIQVPGKTKRNRIAPSSSYTDPVGRPHTHLLNAWGTELLADPTTGVPNVSTRVGPDVVIDMLPDFYGATVLFVEPDRSFRHPDKAYLITNFWPLTFPTVEAKRDPANGVQDMNEFSIEWAALTQEGDIVLELADEIMRGMSITGADPNKRTPLLDKITADVASLKGVGFAEYLASIGRVSPATA